jgi:methylated-DNA-protein-cysteine methyltransferase related protein
MPIRSRPVRWYITPMAALSDGVSDFTKNVETLIRSIPRGRVCTYGEVAAAAGSPLASRQVARVLHARSGLSRLPWQRVVGRGVSPLSGKIALRDEGFAEQISLLRVEGVDVDDEGGIDLETFGWKLRLKDLRQ